jgi:hypothetical protein
MYFALYGMRILGIFPVEIDAINYINEIKNYDDHRRFPRYKHQEALEVKYLGITKMETLSDLEELK